MPYPAKTKVDAFSVSVTLTRGTPPAGVTAIESAALTAARGMGHLAAESSVIAGLGATVVHITRLTPEKGMFVTADTIRRAVDACTTEIG